ncbi:hypothetical protein OPQ81_008560 [Rhizoctonia solani]|nr:hypothetical protein OPQ81_008560 [Rhizoctonia solani]
MSTQIQAIIEGKIDFEGQKLVETASRNVLIGATIFSFIAGYTTQSLQICFASFGLALLVVMLVFVPPWQMTFTGLRFTKIQHIQPYSECLDVLPPLQ